MPRAVAAEELRIGEADGPPELTFGRLGGVTRDPEGRILAVDMQSHDVRVFGRDGRFAFRIGREGEGPGELRGPCCPAFAPDGLLWVRDGGNRRYVGYAVGDTGGEARGHLRMEHGDLNRVVPTTFDVDGSLIDIGRAPDATGTRSATVRFSRTSDGTLARRVEIPEPPAESLSVHEVPVRMGDGVAVRFFYQPYGPLHRVAHGPRGEWADAITSRYAVTWRAPDGAVLRTVRRDVQGPPLSSAERARADSALAEDAKRAGGALPFAVPDRKPPVRNIFFDETGRLWVERSVASGAAREADVWGRDGARAFALEWPAGVDLSSGWVGEREALGIETDSLGVQRIVRLRWD